jgi:hypothetical protein
MGLLASIVATNVLELGEDLLAHVGLADGHTCVVRRTRSEGAPFDMSDGAARQE